MSIVAAEPRRILVVPLRFIGDTVLSVPLIRNIRYAFPHAALDVLVSKTTAPLLEPWSVPTRLLIEPKGLQERWRQLRQGKYDAIFLLRKSVTSALMAKVAGIPIRAGFDKQRLPEPVGFRRWGLGLTHMARYPSLRDDKLHVQSLLGLLHVGDVPVHDSYLELWTTVTDEQNIDEVFEAFSIQQPLAAIHCVSPSTGKSFDADKFIPALQVLHQNQYTIVATGVASDADFYTKLANDAGVSIINLAGKTTLRETVALYKRIQLLLSVDSGPIHLAAAVGVPDIIGVYGPTNHKQWAPYNEAIQFHPVFVDLPCRPCYPQICSHNRCRVTLPSDDIKAAILTAMQ